MLQLVTVLACCLLVGIPYAAAQSCTKIDNNDAWEALEGEKMTAFLLVGSTRSDVEDCLKSTPTGTPSKPDMTVTMKSKEGGDWKESESKLKMVDDKITAVFGDKSEEGTILYRADGCHVTQLKNGDIEHWVRDGSSADASCCKEDFAQRTTGKSPTNPQEKDCK
uniref:Salivary lipocalin n=1 Tax=Ornithodoros coriaceus TaxID=92741 RepID=B2D290_ORNCO|nr:salivary lipocalin [Ornithodoros coriaceus]